MNTLLLAGAVGLGSAYFDAKLGISSDVKLVLSAARLAKVVAANGVADRNSVYYLFETAAKSNPDGDCYVFEGRTLSFREVMTESNRVAHYLLSLGLKSKDVVALLMGNKMAYPIIWLGCLSINVVPSFINTSLVGQGLTHCVTTSAATALIFDNDLSAPVVDALNLLQKSNPSLRYVQWVDRDCQEPVRSFNFEYTVANEALIAKFSDARIPDVARSGITTTDSAVLIFTSGTTGLPKAATVSHGRAFSAFSMWGVLNKFSTKNRVYTAMPLYHSSAALLAVGAGWGSGMTIIIGRNFRASTFWDEVRANRANTIQYVGEVLRYLVAVPPRADDKDHDVRIAYGNGCRHDTWEKFRVRFGVPIIAEFFGATEGNTALFNYNANSFGAGAVGAKSGKIIEYLRKDTQVIVRVDPITEEPARGPDGFCIRADVNEDGELLGFIDTSVPGATFTGYLGNPAATAKKILHSVLQKDDAFFRTGDLLRRDENGFIHFSDRMGDTFRWKGHNVSTSEVALALAEVMEAPNVYGVLVPGAEGRAGCVAVEKGSTFNLEKIAVQVAKTLPKYSQPLFIRVVEKMESTGTQKQLKVKLRNEGVDPSVVKDPIFWLQGNVYKAFTTRDWAALSNGGSKL